MSYSFRLCKVVDDVVIDDPSDLEYEDSIDIDVTFNHCSTFKRLIPGGIRSIVGLSGHLAAITLQPAHDALSCDGDGDDDGWAPTDGNAKRALDRLIRASRCRPGWRWLGW